MESNGNQTASLTTIESTPVRRETDSMNWALPWARLCEPSDEATIVAAGSGPAWVGQNRASSCWPWKRQSRATLDRDQTQTQYWTV